MAKTQSIDSMITNELKKNAEYSPYRGTMSYADFGNIYQNKQDAISYYDTSSADALATYGAQRQASIDYAQSVYDNNLSYAENMKGTTYKTAEQARSQAYRDADLTYQRQAADAQAARYLESAYYGAKGEQLARMGLGASGYSDYLESQAYATSRAEAQAAARDADAAKRSARDAETNAKLNADITYAKYMNDADNARAAAIYDADTSYRTNVFEAERAAREGKMNAELQYRSDLSAAKDKNISNYAAYLQMVNSGDYSKDMLDMMGKTLGLTDAQMESANSNVSEIGGNSNQKAYYDTVIENIISGSHYKKSDVESMASSNKITEEMKTKIIEDENKYHEDQFKLYIGADNYLGALSSLAYQYEMEYIDDKKYKNDIFGVFDKMNDNIIGESKDEDGSELSKINDVLSAVSNTVSTKEYRTLKKNAYSKYYGVKETNGTKYKWSIDGYEDENFGYIALPGSYFIDDTVFKSEVAPDSVASKINNVVDQEEGYIAEYDGDVYMYARGHWRKLIASSNEEKERFIRKFFEKGKMR